jgi:hypothetical protein
LNDVAIDEHRIQVEPSQAVERVEIDARRRAVGVPQNDVAPRRVVRETDGGERLARARGRRGLDRARRLHRTTQIHLERAKPDQAEIGMDADVLIGNRLEHAVARPGERLAADVHGATALDEHLALGADVEDDRAVDAAPQVQLELVARAEHVFLRVDGTGLDHLGREPRRRLRPARAGERLEVGHAGHVGRLSVVLRGRRERGHDAGEGEPPTKRPGAASRLDLLQYLPLTVHALCSTP